jgi:hypothetical protein
MTILEAKEAALVPATALLCEVRLKDQSIRRWASARCQDGTTLYEARVLADTTLPWKLTSDVTSESANSLTLNMADADGQIAQLFKTGLLRGASIRIFAAVLDGRNVESKTAVLSGVLDSVSDLNGRTARFTILNRLSAIRTSFPPMRIQKQCAWMFPSNAGERDAAVNGGEDSRYSPLYRCGYGPDLAGGAGNLDGAAPFTSCDYSRRSCEERGMFSKDGANRVNNRFSGIEFVPPSITVRGHGESSGRISNLVSLDTRFNDVIPAVYGMGWLRAPVVFSRNDGNLTRSEVLLGLGEIDSIIKVIVNGYEIPLGVDGRNMTGTGWYNVVSLGGRTGAQNLGFADSAGRPLGDPYASMAYLNVVVPNRVSDGKSSPKVEVLLKGMKVPVLDAEGNLLTCNWTSNPAWILCDILRRTGWKLEELDLASFVQAAAHCDTQIEARDANGVAHMVPRFAANLVLRRRYSVGELLRSIRLGALLTLSFDAEGKLTLQTETTIANQHPQKPAGSNADAAMLGGWPAYEFGDGENGTSGILLRPNGEPDLRVSSRHSQDTPNRVSFEIQDSLNEFQQDSISIADADDIQSRRQEIQQSLAVLGVPNFPQAQRICQTWLNKNIAGNVYVEFRTSLKGFHLRPGNLIAMTCQRYGFDRTLLRLLEVHLEPRLDTVKLLCQLHQEHWYSDDAQARYDVSRRYAWTASSPRAVIITDTSESLATAPDGSQRCALKIAFERPVSPGRAAVGIPLVSFGYEVQSTGGDLAQGTYYLAVSAVDEAGLETAISSLIPVRIGGLANTNKILLKGISCSPGTQSINLYIGDSPNRLRRAATALPIAGVIEYLGGATSPIPPPDANYVKLHAWFRQTHLVPQEPTEWSENTIGRTGLGLTPNRWAGKKISIREGTGRGQERNIVSHSAVVFTVSRAWDILPDATSRFVVVEPSWAFAAESDSSEIVAPLPLYPAANFEVNLRSVGMDGAELDAQESPSVFWQVGVGGAGGMDAAVPPEPIFSIALLEEGTISLGGIGFTVLENLATVYAGKFTLHYWDELTAPSPLSLANALSAAGEDVTLAGLAAALAEGALIQIGREVLRVTAETAVPGVYTVERGQFDSTAAAHVESSAVFVLQSRVMVIPFVPGFFASTASVGFVHNVRLPNVRLAAGELTLFNRVGESPAHLACFTSFGEGGLRTLSGGQIHLNVQGYLSIEAAAGQSFVVNHLTVVRDVYAYVQEQPVGAPIEAMLRVNGVEYCTLTIPADNWSSVGVDRFNHAPLPPGATVSLDILGVPSASQGTPGKDLTVVLQT